jgi:DNA-binding transcriptional regulator PaaX
MSPRNEELLYFLLWTADPFLSANWRRLDDSFEAWAWRNHLGRRLAELQRQKLIERHPEPNLDRVVRLTEEGRRLALGGRDPIAQWSRPWDGLWRLILFDIPISQPKLRQRFWRTLRQLNFGYLQGSVWATPDSAASLRSLLRETTVQADSLLIVEGRPAAGECDAEIVQAAWDFEEVNRRYQRYLRLLEARLPGRAGLPAWTHQELTAWRHATHLDPFLPQALLPEGYLGFDALREKKRVISRLAVLTER